MYSGVHHFFSFFLEKREIRVSVYYISVVLLTKEEKVDTLLFEFNKMYNH